MRRWLWAMLILVVCGVGPRARAGLYYSSESIAELPSQWSGFLLDQRILRNIAVKPTPTVPASPWRTRYEQAAAALEKAARQRKLGPEEQADLGALYIRLGEIGKAVAILNAASREHSHHFHILANLGTAWQLQGDMEQAADCISQAVRLAPGKYQPAEELQLRLIRLRQRQPRDSQVLDHLFDIVFVGEDRRYQPGKLASAQHAKLPSNAVALVQQLALWLPSDGRLLWQLAELANAGGDIKTATAMMDGCVTEFGMRSEALKEHRRLLRSTADELGRSRAGSSRQVAHEGHTTGLQARSKRPLVNKGDTASLPPISATATNALPWDVLTETVLDRQSRPTFAKYLEELEGKPVALSGFMQPVGEEADLSSFMLIEYPVGCWYCETPALTAIVLVEMPLGQQATFTRGAVKIQGKLALNRSDPEHFLYTIRNARILGID